MTVCVVDDFEAHALWMEQAVDLYCVRPRKLKRVWWRAGRNGNVVVTGIPIAPKILGPSQPRCGAKKL